MALLDQGSGSAPPPPRLPTPEEIAAQQPTTPPSGAQLGITAQQANAFLPPPVPSFAAYQQPELYNPQTRGALQQSANVAVGQFNNSPVGTYLLGRNPDYQQVLAMPEGPAKEQAKRDEMNRQAQGFVLGSLGGPENKFGSELEKQLADSIAARASKAFGITPESQAASALTVVPESIKSQVRKLARGEPHTLNDTDLQAAVDAALTKVKAPVTAENRAALLDALSRDAVARNKGGAALNAQRNVAKKLVTHPTIPGEGSPRGPLAQRIASQAAATTPGAATNEALATARGEAFQPGTGGALRPGTTEPLPPSLPGLKLAPEFKTVGAPVAGRATNPTNLIASMRAQGASDQEIAKYLGMKVTDLPPNAEAVSAAAKGEHAAALPEGAVPPETPPPTGTGATPPGSSGGLWTAFLDAWNLPKALKASWDLSAPGRQGILTAAAHPSEFFGNFGPMVHAFSSEPFAHAVDAEIRAGPKSQIVQEGLARLGFVDKATGLPARSPRLYLAEHQGLSGREEAFMTRLAGKIPLVKNSERAYITYLNKLRADIYDNTLESWFRSGKNVKPSDVDGLADVVNHFTGRGDLAFGTKVTPVLNGAFFSPRFTISRVQSVGDALGLLKSRDSLAAKEAANMLVKSITAGVGMLALAKAGGASVETDPRSSNFGKIKVGDTTYDIWGGQQQLARYVGQFLTGQTKVLTGVNAGNVQTATRGDTLGRFITSKLAPTAGVVWDIINYKPSPKDPPGTIGRNFIGTPFSASDLINPTKSTNLITPLFGQDIADAVAAARGEGQSPIAGAVKGIPSGFGIGVNTIVQTPEQKNAQALADKWYAAPAFSIGNPTEWAAVYRALNQYKTLTAGKTVAQIRADPKLVAFYNSAAGGRLKVYASDSGAIRSTLVSPQRQAIQKDPNFKNLGITIQSILSHLGQ